MSKKIINPHNHLPPFCYDMIGGTTTMERKELKETLLATGGTAFAQGRLCNVKSKHLGCGVYQVWLAPQR